MQRRIVEALFLASSFLAVGAHAQTPDLAGKWHVTLESFGSPIYFRLDLKPSGSNWAGEMFGDPFTASVKGYEVELHCTNQKGKDCGALKGEIKNGVMEGSGILDGQEFTWSARRPPPIERKPARHEFVPKVYRNEFSSRFEPVLKIRPGDTVHTTTVDAGGVDANGKTVAAGGNPLTGPFYIEGAWPGDTLVVKLNRVRLNRDTAGTYADSVVLRTLDPYYVRDLKKVENFDSTWKLDRVNGFAVLNNASDQMKNFQVTLAPFLGCVGVAPGGTESFRSGRLGNYGGNLDYNQLREGTTIYLPVFHPGALLFVGDGHAAQGDGELAGNALETSMEVEFTVEMLEGSNIDQPRAESENFVMVMGIGNSLEDALRSATTGMSSWLVSEFKLNPAEIAMILGSSMRFDIAEVVDPQMHVVAKLDKKVLQIIERAK